MGGKKIIKALSSTNVYKKKFKSFVYMGDTWRHKWEKKKIIETSPHSKALNKTNQKKGV